MAGEQGQQGGNETAPVSAVETLYGALGGGDAAADAAKPATDDAGSGEASHENDKLDKNAQQDAGAGSGEAEGEGAAQQADGEGVTDAEADAGKTEADDDASADDEKAEGDGAEALSIEDFDFDGKDFRDLTAKVTIDGETHAVKLGDLIKGHQIGEAGIKRLREADEIKDAAKQEAEKVTQSVRQQREAFEEQMAINVQALSQVADVLANEKILQMQETALEQLRQSDPAEYAARISDIAKARTAIAQQKQALLQDISAFKSKTQTQQQTERQKLASEGAQQLVKLHPELADKQALKDWGERLVTYATKHGIPENTVRGEVNHNMLEVIDKARRWDEAQAKIANGRKQHRAKHTPTLRPGARSDTSKQKPRSPEEILYS